MLLRRIVRADGGGDAALRVPGVALGRIGFRQDGDAAVSARSMAARKPAMPLPMMRKSVRSPTDCYASTTGQAATASADMRADRANSHMATLRIESPSAGAYPVLIGAGHARDARRSSSIRLALGPRASSCRARSSGTCIGRGFRRSPARGSADPRARRRTLQERSTPSAAVYEALIQRDADRAGVVVAVGGGVIGDLVGFRCRHLLARRPARAGADDAAGAGGQRSRGQGRSQSRAGQEPDRRVPSAARWSSPIRDVLATLPRREFRAGLYEVIKYGVIASAVAARPCGSVAAGDLRPRAGGPVHRSSPSPAVSKPTSCLPTSANPGCDASSTSGTPSVMRWKP